MAAATAGEVPVSFASEPERDDGSLPPVNIVIPDDARELDRDVLAYHREMRTRRRRQRFMRLLRPLNRSGIGGPVAIVPLLALVLALALVGGALLSVVTMSPASAPTVGGSSQASPQAGLPADLVALPLGNVRIGEQIKPVRSLASSVVALVPASCQCSSQLNLLSSQAAAANVPLYYVGIGIPTATMYSLAIAYGNARPIVAEDVDGVLANAYHPVVLTVLLVFGNAKAEVLRKLSTTSQLGLSELKLGAAKPGAQDTPTAT